MSKIDHLSELEGAVSTPMGHPPVLKSELKRRHVNYLDLAKRLGTLGIEESDRNIANKISRGGFSAVFFLQCLEAIDCAALRLKDD